ALNPFDKAVDNVFANVDETLNEIIEEFANLVPVANQESNRANDSTDNRNDREKLRNCKPNAAKRCTYRFDNTSKTSTTANRSDESRDTFSDSRQDAAVKDTTENSTNFRKTICDSGP